MITEEALAHVRALNDDRAAARAVARADGDRVDAARPARDLVADRRAQRRAARGQPRRAAQPGLLRRRAGRRSTATRSRPASTSGRRRATADGATVGADELERWTRALLEAAGLEPEPRRRSPRRWSGRACAASTRTASRACRCTLERLRTGVLNPRPRPSVAQPRRRDRGRRRRPRAPARSRPCSPPTCRSSSRASTASAWSAVRRSGHYGAAAFYARARRRARDWSAMAMTNTEPLVIPYGGSEPALGHEPDRARRAGRGRRLQPRHGDQPGRRSTASSTRATRGGRSPRLGRRRARRADDRRGAGALGGAARRLQGLRARR